MKNALFILLTLLSVQQIYSTEILPNSKITSVTVFPKGAMVNREIDISLLQGEHILELKGLPNSLFKKTITIEGHENIDILSIIPYLELSAPVDTIMIKKLNKQSIKVSDSINYYYALNSILNIEKEMIIDHNNFENDNGNSNIDDVIKASEFYKKRIKEIEIELLGISKSIAHFTNLKNQITIQNDSLVLIQNKLEYRVKIKVNITNKNARPINLKYFVPSAKWYTYYDLRVTDIDQSPILHRKAFVSQNTGEKWDEVKLTLSNANPLQNNQLPSLAPKKLTNPFVQTYISENKLYGKVIDEEGYALIGATVAIENTNNGTITDIEGNFEITYNPNQNIVISYIGYDTQRVRTKNKNITITMIESENLIEEVAVLGYNLHGSSTGVSINQKKRDRKFKQQRDELEKKEAMNLLRNAVVQTKVKALNSIEYQIKEKYSIESDNEETDVLLNIESIDCYYEYFAVPQKSSQTFLTLQIPDWHKLDLLPGTVNLFLSNTYKGKTTINPQVTSDTLSVSIGSDPEVVVERELIKEDYDKKIFGKKAEEYFSYLITIKNNKSKPIYVKILDQIPVSTHEDINIKNVEISNAKLDKESGEVEWKLNILPGQSSSKKLSFSVKYPKEFSGILD